MPPRQSKFFALLTLIALCGCAAAPLRMGGIPEDKAARERLYEERRVRIEDGKVYAGSELMDKEQLRKHFRASGDLTSGSSLSWKPHWMALGLLLGLEGLLLPAYAGLQERYVGGFNVYHAFPLAVSWLLVDASFGLVNYGIPSAERAANRHNARLQATLGLEGKPEYRQPYDHWLWRAYSAALVVGAYSLGRFYP